VSPDVNAKGGGAIMKIKHIMTKDPTCCIPSDTAQRAAKIMRDEDTGVVPIIENEQSRKVIGIVTDRDLCMNVVAEGRDPGATQVHEAMTTTVVSCSPQDSVDKATELMRENQIRRIPVVDEQHRLVGIVAMADIVGRANVRTTETHETLKTVSAPTSEPSKPRARSRKAA
jgi:CBS domain-containing protein